MIKPIKAPAGFSEEEFFQGVYWHQRWEMFEGIFTPGLNDIALMAKNLALPEDLSGKRIMDIGAWNGCLSFECERRGAEEVLAIGPEDPNKSGFWRMHKAIGSKRTRYQIGSVYRLDPKEIGEFDIVLFCGVLYHLRYPLLGLDNIRRVCKQDLYVETQVLEDHSLSYGPDRRKLKEISPIMENIPLWLFHRLDDLNKDFSNWFSPNVRAVIEAMESAGFKARLTAQWPSRATFIGQVADAKPEFMSIGCGESVYYDILIKHLF